MSAVAESAVVRTRNIEFPRGSLVLRFSVGRERVAVSLCPKAGAGQVAFASCEHAELRVQSNVGVAQVLWLGNAAFEVSQDELQRVVNAVLCFWSGEIQGLRGEAA